MIRAKLNQSGFTLPEMLIALAMAGVVSVAMYMTFATQSRTFFRQEQTVEIQQNLRGGMDIMVREMRMACFDPERSGNFGPAIFDIRPRDIDNNVDVSGWGAFEFTTDLDRSGGTPAANETFRYSVYDNPVAAPDGTLDIARDAGGGRQLLVANTEGLVFAFAYADADGDIVQDGGNVRWAIDSTGDNRLDLSLDTNGDGVIDINDNPAGIAINPTVAVGQIRAVKIWLLVRGDRLDGNHVDTATYVMGNRRFTPVPTTALLSAPQNVNAPRGTTRVDERFFQRRLLTETVWMRNCGMGRGE